MSFNWHLLLKMIRLLGKLAFWLTVLSMLLTYLDPMYFAAASTVNPIASLDNPLQPVRDVFYGISTAAPGTFARMIQNWYMKMMANSTTSAAVTAPMSTTTPSIASGAAAIGTGTVLGAGASALILTVIYVVWAVASLVTGGRV